MPSSMPPIPLRTPAARRRRTLALTLTGCLLLGVGASLTARAATTTTTTTTTAPKAAVAASTSLERWVPATTDTYISSAKSTTAFGTTSSMPLVSTSANTQYGYVTAVAPPSTPTNLIGASLELFLTNASAKPLTVSLVDTAQETLTWATQPLLKATLGTVPATALGRVVIPLDIPSITYSLAWYQRADGTSPISMRLAGSGATVTTRETGIPAKLHLTYSDVAPALANPAQMTFTPVAAHPQALAQPSAYGRALNTLTVWGGAIWAGYGDYGANTGPIALTPLDPATNRFAEFPNMLAPAEGLDTLRPISDGLWVPFTQPSNQAQAGKHYAVASGTGLPSQWSSGALPNLLPDGTKPSVKHVFDAAMLPDGSRYIVGALGKYATVWRSGDQGVTWSIARTVAPVAGTDFARFYWAGTLNGKLYVQAHDLNAMKAQATSLVFDGTTWTTGPALISGANTGFHAEEMSGKLVLAGSPGQPRYLIVFDGTTVRILTSLAVRNFTVDRTGTTPVLVVCCKAVSGGQRVYTSTDLTTFDPFGPVMASGVITGNSIAVTQGDYYGRAYWIGDSQGRIWRFG